MALLFLVAVFPCWSATLTCGVGDLDPAIGNVTTVSGLNASVVCGTPPATASVSNGTDASVNAPSGYENLGAGAASVEFDVIETWTVLGGTGSGLIYIEAVPPFISAAVLEDYYADDDLLVSGLLGFEVSSTEGYYGLDGIPFTFGVPFSFDVSVLIDAYPGYDGGRASVNYDTTSETYQIEPITSQTPAPWQFYQAGTNLTSITLERSAEIGVLTPEPSLLWPSLAVLLVLGTLRYGPMKNPTL